MLFNSFDFLLFLPFVFLLYWFVFKSYRWQNLFVVVVSYFFYGWWDWRFLILIAFTSICSFSCGLLIEYFEGNRLRQRLVSVINIVTNLLVLGAFKYYNFFVDSLESAFSLLGYHMDPVAIDIILPVGISFYTFQALSYTIDVYQRKIAAEHDIITFFAYVSFFPQLVAGPIERATNLLPQFQRKRHFEYSESVDGCRQMLWGFFKKMVVADNCAGVVNEYWGRFAELPNITLLLLGVLFTFQIYCDFSGYSDIAIGCARLFGIKLMRNFNFPYYSRDISEFWRRWHISLMTWFRDYIYIPLGGNRCVKRKIIRNTMIVFFVSGLWHGANWTFVLWGIYHACLISLFMLIGWNNNTKGIVTDNKILPSIKESIQMISVFFLVVIGWIIFRSESVGQAFGYLTAMFSNCFFDSFLIPQNSYLCVAYCMALLIIEWLQRDKQHALQFSSNRLFSFRLVRWSVYYLIIYVIARYNGYSQNFIYFQF